MLSGFPSAATRELSQLIAQEETACRALLETVYEERAAIRTLAVTEFPRINARRIETLEILQRLADQRAALILRLSRHYHLPPSAATLHGVIQAAAGHETGLRAQYDRYLATARTVREQVKHNVVLIENIREFLDNALSAGTAVMPGHDLYASNGQTLTAPVHAALVRQQG
jgi:hypothetical protein